MFNKTIADITFHDVETFCREWPEGIRVEYKRQVIENIPKSISAFANTLGGILIIGVADPKTNRVLSPIVGMDQENGIEERLIQSSLTGIYPGILPEVKVLDVPGHEKKVVVVVKIHESPDAPHAIQNSTRVYVRTGNISSPYDLAEIDRIEYLLKRRDRPERLREEIIAKSEIRFRDHISEPGRTGPLVSVTVSRLFPREQIISPDALYNFVTSQRPTNRIIQYFIDRARRVQNGVFSIGLQNSLPYAELNTYGVVLTRSQLQLSPSSWKPNAGILFVRPAEVIWTIARSLKLAEEFFKSAKFSGTIRVTVGLLNVLNQPLQYSNYEDEDKHYTCCDRDFSVSEVTSTEDLVHSFRQTVATTSNEVFWSFNCDYKQLDGKVDAVLRNDTVL